MLSRPITPIDETRYLGVAWEMWLRGDFLVPYKNGEPYSHKPPLMMWMFHTGWALFGVNAWWPRLVSPLFSAGAIWLTYQLALRLWPTRHGLGGRAAMVLASCLVWAISSTWVMFDVMLAFFVLLGMHGMLMAADGKRLRGFALLGLAIGLGVLTKGPVILLHLLPAAVLAPWWRPGMRWASWYGGIFLAILYGATIALLWAIPAGIAGGDEYQKAIFWGQTANRMVESFAHQRPTWWYLALLPVLLFPWFVWPTLWRSVWLCAKQGLDPGGRFCVAWSAPVFIAFSFVSGKQLHYLMPLFPAFALLVARVVAGGRRGEKAGSGLVIPLFVIAIIGVSLLLLASGTIPVSYETLPKSRLILAGLTLIFAGIAAYYWHRQQPRSLVILGLAGALLPILLQWASAPVIYPANDVRPMAQAIRQAQDQNITVAHEGKYHDQYHFFGRLQKPLIALPNEGLASWLTQNPAAWAVLYVRDTRVLQPVRTLARQPYRGKTVVLVDAKTALILLSHPEALMPQP
ncbi:MAG: ArnT family glycosyltransferase [Thiobacillus sp.]